MAGAAIAALLASSASAHPPHKAPGFTLRQAHAAAVRYERANLAGRVTGCHWTRTRRKASCSVDGGMRRIFDELPPVPVSWTDVVTRAGGCPTPVVRRTGHGSGIAHGGGDGRLRSCFSGRLVVWSTGLEF